MFDLLCGKPSSFLGIDIGTMGIKIVQLGREKNKLKLETYGLLETYDSFELLNNSLRIKNSASLNNRVSELLSEVIQKSKVTAKRAAMSIPIFSTFSTLVELPDMSDNEIRSAMPFEARKYIPIPLDEVILGWSVVGRKDDQREGELNGRKLKKVQILLVAISKEIAKRYTQIAKLAGLKVDVLETESFSLARSLIRNGSGQGFDPVVIVDIGSRTTNIIVVGGDGLVMKNHSVDMSGDEITRALSYGLGVDFERAESLKRNFGLGCQGISGKKIYEIAIPLADVVVAEVEKMMRYYFSKRGKQVKKIILTGGSANLKGLDSYFNKKLGLTIERGNPWKGLSYPDSLSPILREIAPSFSVAVGLAIAGFDRK